MEGGKKTTAEQKMSFVFSYFPNQMEIKTLKLT